jgi:hypothetical protein
MKTLCVLAATACLAATGGSTSIGAVHRSAACATKAGQVLSYLPSAARLCVAAVFDNDSLYATETIKTGSPVGGFTFTTTGLYQCHESPGARDTVRPSPSVALKHLQGTTWCKRKPHSKKQFLTTKGAKIKTTGTIFGIQSGKRSVIKVSKGRLQVIPTATKRPITLRAGRQLSVSAKGVPGKPRRFAPTRQDRFAVFLLRSGDLESGTKQVAEYLRVHDQSRVVVVFQDDAARREVTTGLNANAATIDAAQARKDPATVRQQVESLNAMTVAVAGSFSAMQPVLKAVRASVPSSVALLFVPAE